MVEFLLIQMTTTMDEVLIEIPFKFGVNSWSSFQDYDVHNCLV